MRWVLEWYFDITLPCNEHIPSQGTFEDDFPFSKVWYVTFQEYNFNGVCLCFLIVKAMFIVHLDKCFISDINQYYQ